MMRVLLASVLVAMAVACGNDAAPSDDASNDSGVQDSGSQDSGSHDSAVPDSGSQDSGMHDAGDSGAPPDSGSDDDDAGPMDDASIADMWADCPTSADFVGPSSGPTTLHVTDTATYCVLFNEFQTFAEARAAKAMVRFAPGDYPLGTTSGVNVRLPTCFRTQAATQPTITMAAPLTYMKDSIDTYDIHNFSWDAPIEHDPAKAELQFQLNIQTELDGVPSITLDGTENDVDLEDDARYSMYFCAGAEDCGIGLVLDSCSYDTAILHTHSVTLEGGSIELALRIGSSFASTEPGAFTGATGTWHGTSFEQDDYFKLIYVPFHHHFMRSFLVLFDEPIDGACGLRVSDLDPFEPTSGAAATVDCELQDIATVAITAHEHTTQ